MNHINYLSDLFSAVFVRAEHESADTDSLSMDALCDALLDAPIQELRSQYARELLRRLANATRHETIAFFELLSERYNIDNARVLSAARHFVRTREQDQLKALQKSLQPAFQDVFIALSDEPDGLEQLLTLRATWLDISRTHAHCAVLDSALGPLCQRVFALPCLELKQLDCHTPVCVMQKVINHFAHLGAGGGLDDLQQYLTSNQGRMFALFHVALPDEPLVFAETALTAHGPLSLQSLQQHPIDGNSDNNDQQLVLHRLACCHQGAEGLALEAVTVRLLKQHLCDTEPSITAFTCLAPLPDFMPWIQAQLDRAKDLEHNSQESDDAIWIPHIAAMRLAQLISQSEKYDFSADERDRLRQLVAHYLLHAERIEGLSIDRCARIHLSNGATLEDIWACADVSASGLRASAGVLVSYRYELETTAQKQTFIKLEDGLCVSDQIRQLAEPPIKVRKRA